MESLSIWNFFHHIYADLLYLCITKPLNSKNRKLEFPIWFK